MMTICNELSNFTFENTFGIILYNVHVYKNYSTEDRKTYNFFSLEELRASFIFLTSFTAIYTYVKPLPEDEIDEITLVVDIYCRER